VGGKIAAIYLAKNSLQLAKPEEWDKQHEQEHRQSQNSLQPTSPKVRDTLRKGLPVIKTDGGVLQNLETGSTMENKADFRRVGYTCPK